MQAPWMRCTYAVRVPAGFMLCMYRHLAAYYPLLIHSNRHRATPTLRAHRLWPVCTRLPRPPVVVFVEQVVSGAGLSCVRWWLRAFRVRDFTVKYQNTFAFVKHVKCQTCVKCKIMWATQQALSREQGCREKSIPRGDQGGAPGD